MPEPTASQLAHLIISRFDQSRSEKLETLLAHLLRDEGVGLYQAQEQAYRLKRRVLELLRRYKSEELPFYFADTDPERLVGKRRPSGHDTIEITRVREALGFVDAILETIYQEGPEAFEVLCAASLKLLGAREMFTTGSRDEGGIDLYGRIAIRPSDRTVPTGLLQTSLLNQEVLVLGQCKCYRPDQDIGPSAIQQFRGAVEACLNKYEGNPNPPSHRVPEAYYNRNELCIPVFMTTADYSGKAAGAAEASQIVAICGREIAQFFAYKGIGFGVLGNPYNFDPDLFRSWLSKEKPSIT